jgi:hypothetical protein
MNKLEVLRTLCPIFEELSFITSSVLEEQFCQINLHGELHTYAFAVVITMHEQYHRTIQRYNLIRTYLQEYPHLRALILMFEYMFLGYFVDS